MKLYSPVILPFADVLATIAEAQMSEFTENNSYVKDIIIPDEFRNLINLYLQSKGVSEILNILSFKRKLSMKKYYLTHVDSVEDSVVKNSVVIPVSGCENTSQYWYTGPYELIRLYTISGASYLSPKWKHVGEFLGEVEILSPMLCRTDIPHSGHNPSENYRTTVTIRFKDNEDFEYLAEKLST